MTSTMSRLIVKNLPHGLKEEKLRKHFDKFGAITDCSMKFTKDGQFRRFAFIGYKTAKEAETALAQCNNTYINTSKIQVELAKDLGDTNKSRSWSKYSKDKIKGEISGSDKLHVISADNNNKTEKKKAKKKVAVVDELLGELKDDPKFHEFLETHTNVSVKPVWTNDGVKAGKGDSQVTDPVKSDLPFDDDDDDVGDSESIEDPVAENPDVEMKDSDDDETEAENTMATKQDLSDLDYLRSKVDQKLLSDSDSSDADSDDDSDADSDSSDKDPDPTNQCSSKEKESQNRVTTEKVPTEEKPVDQTEEETDQGTVYMLDLKGLPSNCGEKAVREFFVPLEVVRLKVPKNAKKKPLGIAHVGFRTEQELEQALRRNKNFIGGKRVYLRKAKPEQSTDTPVNKQRTWEVKQQADGSTNVDEIAETGRVFVRNLSYSCTEEDLEAEFGKYGPLTEVNLPIDSLTRKLKGFGFVTFMMPEHAIKAYTELDGKVFQGRMLHILPGKEKKEESKKSSEKSSYKKEKEKKQKAQAGSSHNWNTLFLGANAVADVLAQKYGASKRDILDTEAKGSLGVRMALGETQIVSETRDFLLKNGVALDSFSQPNAPRSKTVILVKNLPAKTAVSDISTLFGQYGQLGRVLLPPSGVTAVVEFTAPTEARSAFTKLAYSKFQHVPLYLEWAPMEMFTTPAPESNVKTESMETSASDSQSKEPAIGAQKNEEGDQPEQTEPVGSTLFVKNLNFSTTDSQLQQLFESCGKVRSAVVAKKKDMKNPGQTLSLGYGFVEFLSVKGAEKAVKQLQHTTLDGHKLELKVSHRTTAAADRDKGPATRKPRQEEKEQNTTKILVRNIPFEANKNEVEELFKVFGELKSVRLPKKLSGTGSHRGFAFVDFLTKQDAKRAFESLCHSSHLFGRRLVLEWAKVEDDLDDIRKRTTQHFHEEGGKKKFTKANLKESLEMATDL